MNNIESGLMRLVSVLLVPVACCVSLGAIAQTMPAGWRAPVATDAQVDAERVSLPMLRVEADFNSDAVLDQAAVLFNNSDPHLAGVFVFISRQGATLHPHKLDQYRFAEGEFMLSVVKPGCYRSEQNSVCLRNPGLLRAEIEYGWSTLYWLQGSQWQQLRLTRGEYDGL